MTDWVRLWHDMPTDPKWRTIARKSGQRVGDVIAVFNFLMVNASSNADARGTITGFDPEDVATVLDLDESEVQAILSAMQGKVLDGNRLTGWEKRQPKREDGGVGARVAKHRETKRNAVKRDVTQCNAPETETETDIPSSNEDGPVLVDPEKVMFDSGVALITSCGKSEGSARSWLGKAKGRHGAEAVITMIGRAKREGSPDPIAFMEAGLRARSRDSPEIVSPC